MGDSDSAIRDYHRRTQHHLDRYARSLGWLDWASQPDPFRRYIGADRVRLPLREPDGSPSYRDLFGPGLRPLAHAMGSVAQLFQDSLALSAWKEHGGSRWALRVNPSSGNLHPTEGYLLTGPEPGLCSAPTLFHYAPDEHALERRAVLPEPLWRRLADGLPPATLLVGLTSIPWREAWKYGERALRYCMHDVGHALGALGFAAAAAGWRSTLLPVPEPLLGTLLAVDDQDGPEAEHADCLLAIHAESGPASRWAREWVARVTADAALREGLRGTERAGTPAPLSDEHHDWPALDAAVAASRLPAPPGAAFWTAADSPITPPPAPAVDARRLFQQRRSAVAMDGRTGTAAATLFGTLARALDPRSPPLAMFPGRGRVHLLLFVHRVDGLPPGLYCLPRGGRSVEWLRSRMRNEFLWEPAAGAPADLPLHLLLPIDCRDAARTVSCHQEIAADSAFAVAMLAELDGTLAELGAWGWRMLHWEAGAIGQLLYLEAEAAGLRATGIGCFFDSAVHEVLGIRSEDLRTIYHFTVGGAVDDPRLRTGPPYLDRAARPEGG